MESNSEYSQGSSQRRRVSKPLIEKRRRARINRSLSQLVEMVAKPNKMQENRTARFEKAYILEMTVEYVKKINDKRILPATQGLLEADLLTSNRGQMTRMTPESSTPVQNFYPTPMERRLTHDDESYMHNASLREFGPETMAQPQEKPSYDEHENSFQDGYRLCMTEIQNFFNKSSEKKASEELLMKSLLKYLCRKIKVPPTSSDTFPDAQNGQIERSQNSAVSWLGYEATEDDKTGPTRTSNRISMISDYKSEIPCTDSYSSASLPSTEDEGTFSVSESDSSISDEKVFYDRKIQNEVVNKILLNQGQTETQMWRPW